MKPYSYYETTSVSIPTKDKYTTTYYYRKGTLIGIKVGPHNDDFEPPLNCVEEKVLDEVSYQAHLKLYHEQNKRLQEEFKQDLFEKYSMTHHPKATKLFNKAWELGSSFGLYEVEGYFQDLMELLEEPTTSVAFV